MLQASLFPGLCVKALLTWKAVTRVGPGLRNLENACFLNATLQCLSYLPPLAHCLLSHWGHTAQACRAELRKHVFSKLRSPDPTRLTAFHVSEVFSHKSRKKPACSI